MKVIINSGRKINKYANQNEVIDKHAHICKI